MTDPLRIAVVGSGPAGLYAATELAKLNTPPVQVNMIDRLPSMGGLARAGVAPDHAKRRLVIPAYEKASRRSGRFSFFGNVEIGRHLSHQELLQYHHAVIYATGASDSQPLNIPGAELPGCYAASAFAGWYNGHPDFSDLDIDTHCERAIVIGNGNVALDVARLLLKSENELSSSDMADHARRALSRSNIREVVLIGRRGPAQASFTHPELRELGHLQDVAIEVPPDLLKERYWPDTSFLLALRRQCLQEYTATHKPSATKTLRLRFLCSPRALLGERRVSAISLMKNRLVSEKGGYAKAEATGQTVAVETGLVVHAIGYRACPLAGLPFDAHSGSVPNCRGRVTGSEAGAGTYVTGWIKHGPRGVIGSNKPCARETVVALMDDYREGRLSEPRSGSHQFKALVDQRQADWVDYRGWRSIDEFEQAQAEGEAPRRKLCSIESMLKIARPRAPEDSKETEQFK